MSAVIERRSKLSYEEFAHKYLYANRPVIVTDAMREWKALSRWSPEFFKKEFGDMKFTINNSEMGQSDYKSGSGTEFSMSQFIDQVLASTDEKPAPYFRNQVLYDLFPSLKEDIQPLPDYFLPNWLPDHYVLKPVREILNRGAAIELYIGGKGGSFPVLHYDGAGTHAFLMQIYGRKQYIVFPPEEEKFLYPSPEKINLSLINNVERPDLQRFPLFANAKPVIFVLEAGELLFVPSHWWHTAKMLTPSITISINVLNQSNWSEMVEYVARRRRNPLASFASRVYLSAAGAARSWRDRKWRERAHSYAA